MTSKSFVNRVAPALLTALAFVALLSTVAAPASAQSVTETGKTCIAANCATNTTSNIYSCAAAGNVNIQVTITGDNTWAQCNKGN